MRSPERGPLLSDTRSRRMIAAFLQYPGIPVGITEIRETRIVTAARIEAAPARRQRFWTPNNPTLPGCGTLAILLRCSLGRDRCGYRRFARALENHQIVYSNCHPISGDRTLGIANGCSSISAVKYTTLVVGMVQLRATGTDASANPQKNLRCCKHAQQRRSEIDPSRVPVAGKKC